MTKTDFLLIIALVTTVMVITLVLGLQLQLAHSSNITNSNSNISILCSEIRILNSLVQDTEVLPSTAAGQSTTEAECNMGTNITKGQGQGNQNND